MLLNRIKERIKWNLPPADLHPTFQRIVYNNIVIVYKCYSPEEIVEGTEGGGLCATVPVHDEEGSWREVVLPALYDGHQAHTLLLQLARLAAAPARREDDPDDPGRTLPALQSEVLGLVARQQPFLCVLYLQLADPQRVILRPEDVEVRLRDAGEYHDCVHVLLPDEPPEVDCGVLLGVLGQYELSQTVEAWDPTGIDVIRAVHVLHGGQDHPGAVHGQEVKALVLQLVGRQCGRPEARLPRLVAGHLVPVSL